MIRVFIGYDADETVAYHVLAHSILARSRVPVSITPLKLSQLTLTRARDPMQSTEFAFSRFLVPWLCDYEGFAIFMDCDMLMRVDIFELWQLQFNSLMRGRAVGVVKHDYSPLGETKFLDRKQTAYPRKNWSSVMLFDNARCRALTPDYVNTASGLELHRFAWLKDEDIASLPREWNHLVGEFAPNPTAKLVHFTLGTPCFKKYQFCEYAQEWINEKHEMLHYEKGLEYSRAERQEEVA